ncbi:hypothetical protein M422DRAFT_259217 [Sphaerobolus stellatus SS14]|uniref:Uncharacterized protein n=1 Tax=Sphaerobolus stellatus (strain SS14) TaxID=990650 RepID=A0A0C9UT65_SPHS4|nr:hypothetical protein M422DRAFT_259217 [Sphaerobolus stellatus SS14]
MPTRTEQAMAVLHALEQQSMSIHDFIIYILISNDPRCALHCQTLCRQMINIFDAFVTSAIMLELNHGVELEDLQCSAEVYAKSGLDLNRKAEYVQADFLYLLNIERPTIEEYYLGEWYLGLPIGPLDKSEMKSVKRELELDASLAPNKARSATGFVPVARRRYE